MAEESRVIQECVCRGGGVTKLKHCRQKKGEIKKRLLIQVVPSLLGFVKGAGALKPCLLFSLAP